MFVVTIAIFDFAQLKDISNNNFIIITTFDINILYYHNFDYYSYFNESFNFYNNC